MFEVLANLILTSLFLQSQADSQATIDNLTQQEYRLPNSAVRYLQQTAPQQKVEAESLGVSVTAKSVLVIDKKSAKILYQKNPDRIRSIASLTKLMTALVFLDHNPGWDKTIKLQKEDFVGIFKAMDGLPVTIRLLDPPLHLVGGEVPVASVHRLEL